jgi:hypothetical protein
MSVAAIPIMNITATTKPINPAKVEGIPIIETPSRLLLALLYI